MASDPLPGFTQLGARSLRGEWIPFRQYEGQVVLIVNTASECGFTPQYEGLEKLYSTFAEQGLVVLGFPCNQFGEQEPGDAESIEKGCLLHFGVTFPVFDKVEVKGPGQHPLFAWLTAKLPGLFGKRIRWNFTKFLLDRQGRPVKRFAPTTKPEALEAEIRRLLG